MGRTNGLTVNWPVSPLLCIKLLYGREGGPWYLNTDRETHPVFSRIKKADRQICRPKKSYIFLLSSWRGAVHFITCSSPLLLRMCFFTSSFLFFAAISACSYAISCHKVLFQILVFQFLHGAVHLQFCQYEIDVVQPFLIAFLHLLAYENSPATHYFKHTIIHSR